ncbi:hypothetical protein GCM10027610_144560 [Dactylosporangium cerinum]
MANYLHSELCADAADDRQDLTPELLGTDAEPIAIVGMSCRLPGGVSSPEELWRLVDGGVDAMGGFPTDRGWDVAGGDFARVGGFVADAAGFDADLFGISPREAVAMDPQQRLLLEAAWEVVERASLDPLSLRGTRTGVFVGASTSGYGLGGTGEGDGYLLTGTANSVISGRVAYALGLEGPAVTVDTACSSSLVALHLASQALRAGECSLAVAGGVTVMPSPAVFGEFARQGGLAGDGRCKSFAAGADGTGWSEGVAVLLVERLSDAQRNGHEVLAVVRGSAVNQDGASNGLTAPNGPSQERVIRQALANARLVADDVDVVEGHGTGTRLGDPIEAHALHVAYGRARESGRSLWLGSLKSNIGHTQAASGVAGVIKMVMAMRHGTLPQTLHVDAPSPHVDWSSGAVELLTESQAWPETGRPRRAAVSSFGISGTNAHTIIEQAPAVAEPEVDGAPRTDGGVLPVVVAARSTAALHAQAGRLREQLLADPDTGLHDVAWSLVTTRAGLEHRAVVLSSDRDSLTAALEALAAGGSGSQLVTGSVTPGRTAFLFTGQGAQRSDMGAGLYERFPVFADAYDAVCARFDTLLDQPLRDADVNQTVYTQAALFAVEVALFRLLESFGVRPDFLLGHSIGELAAAHVADVLSLDDAVALVAARGRLMQALPAGGAMLAVQATEAEVLSALEPFAGRVDIAAVNGPTSIVVSGDAEVIDQLFKDRKTSRLTVSHAFHSPLMEPMLEEFRAVAAGLTYAPPRIPIISNLTGQPVEVHSADYWVRHVREAVRFADGVAWLESNGVTRFLEVGPSGVLTAMAQQCLTGEPVLTAALRKDRDEPTTLLHALSTLHVNGAAVDWTAILPQGRIVGLPTYAFQRERYWLQHAPAPSADPVEDGFWAAVEREDADTIAATLGVSTAGELTSLLPALSAWRRRQRAESVVHDWRYDVAWKHVADLPAATLTGTWVVAAAPGDGAGDVVEALRSAGAEPVELPLTDADLDRAAFAARLGALGELSGVLVVCGSDLEPVMPLAVSATVVLVQALADLGSSAKVWGVTRGAVAVDASERVSAVAAAQLWGLGRVVALEQPHRWGGLIDLADRVDAGLAGVLAQAGEDQVAVRRSGVFARRLVTAPAFDVSARRVWRPRGTILVTGGTGGLGGHVARWLAGLGAPSLVLAGRRGLDTPGVDALVSELVALGARVDVVACDVADGDAVAELLAAVPADLPLSGVVHAAGVDDAVEIADLDLDRLAGVLRGKVAGAAHLDRLLAGVELDLFVVFSSIAGVWGSGGQGAYAAANAFLDALVQQRRARGEVGTALAWGPWAEAGMLVDAGAESYLRRRGLVPMPPALAVRALAAAVEHNVGAAVVADVDWSRFCEVFTAGRASRLFDLLPGVVAPAVEAVGVDGVLRRRLLEVPGSQQRQVVLALVRSEVAAVLGHADVAAVEPGKPFKALGFDSLTAVELRNRLAAVTGLTLPVGMVFDYPTPLALAEHLRGALLGEASSVELEPVVGRLVDEPIAIVGMSCRYAGGVDSPEDLWRLVRDGADGVSSFPTNRGWNVDALYNPDPDNPGTSTTAQGGFLHDADAFDAAFFGISPREALAMDPQQRLLLETTWEAFERAGLDPHALAGSRTGVFVGTNVHDYLALLANGSMDTEGYLATGSAASVISGRIAYAFGLEGPAVSVDTACSSSLVALHLAVQSLRAGECSLAVAGGVAVMSTPGIFTEFSRQRGLAADGRCKAFAAAADGTGWGEGVGLLLVERLSDARRNGHQVLAVVRGSAVNQDGASNGLTAPNGPSQQRVIRQALAIAGLNPADVDAVEAHGTGTRLGDPIEAEALLATYGQGRPADSPLWLGSVKSNIGHTQAAAGVAGVIKMVMAMQQEVLPQTLHVDAPSPHVDWSSGAVELLTEARSWPRSDRPRRAGVSSFGMSGTNAHVIVEEPEPSPVVEPSAVAGPVPWLISGRSPAALRAQAAQLADFAATDVDVAAVARALATTRAALEHRAVVVAEDAAGFIAGLETVEPVNAAAGSTGVVLVFPGQGGQWPGMAVNLLESSPVFAARLRECDAVLDFPLVEVLTGGDQEWLEQVDVVQPVLWAVMVSLAAVWESFGVQVAGVVGHSQGEIAAAVVAGALSLADGALVVSARSRLLRDLAGTGGMLVVGAPVDELGELPDGVSVAAVNGPRLIVVSGDNAGLDAVAAACAERGVWAKRVPVDYASHSVHVEAIREPLLAALDGLTAQQCRLPFYSTVTGELIDGTTLDARYWFDNLRHPVRFDDVIASLVADGHTAFVEVSPHPVLTGGVGERANVVVGTLRRDEGGWDRMLRSAGELWAGGIEVDWPRVLGETTGVVDLPTYPFQRQRFWPSSAGEALLGAGVQLADGDGTVFTGRVSLSTHPWLADHRVLDRVLLPGTAFVELALHAGAVRELTIEAPLVIPDTGSVTLQVRVGALDETGDRPVRISSRSEDSWTHHATGLIAAEAANPTFDLVAWPPPGADPVDLDGFYERGEDAGYGYGPVFQGLRRAWRVADDVYAEVVLPESATAAGFGLHPALLDAALHAVSLGDFVAPGEVRLPFAWTGINLHAIGAAALRVRIAAAGTDAVTVDVADSTGAPVASIDSLTLLPVSRAQVATGPALQDSLFHTQWTAVAVKASVTQPTAVVLGDAEFADRLGVTAVETVGDAVGVVILPVTDADAGVAGADVRVRAGVHRVLSLVQEWLAQVRPAGDRLVVLTRGAVAVDGPVTDLVGAAVWGLLRSAQSENPDRIVLLDTDGSDTSLAVLLDTIGLDEPQLAVRNGAVSALRLVRALPATTLLTPQDDAVPHRVEVVGGGTLHSVGFVPAEEAAAPLAAGQVRVAVRAAGINFRDVAIALGMVPDQQVIGSEAAGVVVEVGPGVTDLTVGDRVFGLFSGAFGPLAVTDRRVVAPMPQGWTFPQAASVPVVFLTAYYALRDLTSVQPGERLLVHAAAGGVGMAAVQLARHWGVEVYGTASPAKWDALRSLGLDDAHIASSRDLDFEATFRTATQGRGVDVVLNSLAGQYIDASLRLLGPGGRFSEMGKTDKRDPAVVAAAHDGVSYRAFDLAEAGLDRVGAMLTEVLALFDAGVLQVPPVTAWDLRDAAAAFRYMGQARHIGKNAFIIPTTPQGTVLITGGTGLLGGLFAEHLVRTYGIRDLVLTSRQGMDAPGAAELVDRLAELGAHAEVVACDAANRDALAAVIAGRTLSGVVHCAGVLDDGVFASLTPDRLDGVLRPKVDAAVHLHELTKHMDLAWFVVFSSASATFGSAGQANYAAANAFLDGLMSYRRSLGLPGLSLAWGLWAEASTMTGHLDGRDKTRIGSTLSNDHGLALFDQAIQLPHHHQVPITLHLSTPATTAPPSRHCSGPSSPQPDAAPPPAAPTPALLSPTGSPPGPAASNTRPSSTSSPATPPLSWGTPPPTPSPPTDPSKNTASTPSPPSNCATDSTPPPDSDSPPPSSSTTQPPPHSPNTSAKPSSGLPRPTGRFPRCPRSARPTTTSSRSWA